MSDTKRPRTEFSMTFKSSSEVQKDDHQAPKPSAHSDTFYIAILGDFSGRENLSRHEPATIGKRRCIEVDCDNLDSVFAKYDLELQLNTTNAEAGLIAVPIKSLDDFLPDRLLNNVAIFNHLRQLRRRLQNNATFAAAAAEIQGWSQADSSNHEVTPHGAEAFPVEDGLFETVITTTRASSEDARSRSGSALVDRLIRQIVAPYVESSPDPRQEQMLSAVDSAIADLMRTVLHHPAFQAIEAAWRSIEFLVNRIETGPTIKLFLLDVTKAELDSDLAVDDIANSGMHKLFCDKSPGTPQFGLLLGNYQFHPSVDDILLLAQLGEIAQRCGAPFIAAGHEQLVGCESFATNPDVDDWNYPLRDGVKQAWTMLRESAIARKLAITVPRFLLRLPYGKRSNPVEGFTFEEMPNPQQHSNYLWGNGAFVKAEQLVRAITEEAVVVETKNLPLFTFIDDGEQVTKACAEIFLTERGGRRIRDMGLLPLWSVKHSDMIRSNDFCSLALSGQSI